MRSVGREETDGLTDFPSSPPQTFRPNPPPELLSVSFDLGREPGCPVGLGRRVQDLPF